MADHKPNIRPKSGDQYEGGYLVLGDIDGVSTATPNNGDSLAWNTSTGKWEPTAVSGGAPTTADYLTGSAQAGLSAEIVVGTTPGGELGGTWASPTVDATHSGTSHAGVVSTHEAASDPHTGYLKESNTIDFLVGTATVELGGEIVVGTSPGGELGGTWASPTVDATHSGTSHAGVVATHEAASDPHTGYRQESADHSHASTGLQGGLVAHSALSGLTANNHHNQAHSITGVDHTGFPGGSTTFLRADGTFATPAGGGGSTDPLPRYFILI